MEEWRTVLENKSYLSFVGSLIFSRPFAKYIFHSSAIQRAQNLAVSSCVEISSLVLILHLQPLAHKLLLIVGLGKGLKIDMGGRESNPQGKAKMRETQPH